jgi:hypothetical protein
MIPKIIGIVFIVCAFLIAYFIWKLPIKENKD